MNCPKCGSAPISAGLNSSANQGRYECGAYTSYSYGHTRTYTDFVQSEKCIKLSNAVSDERT